MARGKGKTKIVSTNKSKVAGSPSRGGKPGKSKTFSKYLAKKVRRTHKGYTMKNIIKGQMTFKKGKKR